MRDINTKTAPEIEEWLTAYLAKMLRLDAATIDVEKPLQKFGLDSAAAVELTMDLSDWVGIEMEPTVVFEHRTIRALAAHTAGAAE